MGRIRLYIALFVGKKFMCLVQQVSQSLKITYKEIKWHMDPIFEYYAT